MQDWLLEAQEGVARALEIRGDPHYVPRSTASRKGDGDGTTVVLEQLLPAACRRNELLEAELANVYDALIIGAAQAEATVTRRREAFILTDGATGSVDAAGELYDERPPQG